MIKRSFESIQALHQKGIVHLDAFPHNVLVKENGGVELIDFGFSKTKEGDPDGLDLKGFSPARYPAEYYQFEEFKREERKRRELAIEISVRGLGGTPVARDIIQNAAMINEAKSTNSIDIADVYTLSSSMLSNLLLGHIPVKGDSCVDRWLVW